MTRERRAAANGRILVVDDDPDLREVLETALEVDGHEVVSARDGCEALVWLSRSHADAVVLDVVMPHLDGLSVCRRLRRGGNRTPVLLLTARDAVEDRVTGLDLGADDYLAKPFALGELLARVRALVRRGSPGDTDGPVWFGDLVLDRPRYIARRGSRQLQLTRTEFEVLALLLRHRGHVLSRGTILEEVWGNAAAATQNAVEVVVCALRRKLEEGGEPRLLQTVRGVGYCLREA